MKLSKVQEKRLQKNIRTLKDNTIDVLIDDGIFVEITREVLKKKEVTFEEQNEMSEEIIDRLFK